MKGEVRLTELNYANFIFSRIQVKGTKLRRKIMRSVQLKCSTTREENEFREVKVGENKQISLRLKLISKVAIETVHSGSSPALVNTCSLSDGALEQNQKIQAEGRQLCVQLRDERSRQMQIRQYNYY